MPPHFATHCSTTRLYPNVITASSHIRIHCSIICHKTCWFKVIAVYGTTFCLKAHVKQFKKSLTTDETNKWQTLLFCATLQLALSAFYTPVSFRFTRIPCTGPQRYIRLQNLIIKERNVHVTKQKINIKTIS